MVYLKKIGLLVGVVIIMAGYCSPVFALEQTAPDTTFEARVTKVILEEQVKQLDGGFSRQQNLELVGLDGAYIHKTLEYNGIGQIDAIKKNIYHAGDRVLVVASSDDVGHINYYITDYVRTDAIWWLGGIFIAILLLIGGWKGFRSLLSLMLTFVVMMWYIVPQILDGSDPVIVTTIGSLVILGAIIYVTEGFKREAHVGVLAIFISLMITIGFSYAFINLAKLSGLATEESSFLLGLGVGEINFQGLLLAGMIIGALGVLDDVVIAQVATVKEISAANINQSRWDVYKRAHAVGIAHISSMTNTLFLAYAGASLSLLILFSSGQSGFANWHQAINNEMLATEIVRTLVGSIGLVLAVPISTGLALWLIKKEKA
ncbi:MAG: YibE/F family protein [Candidatus Falkowbacteria bacterium]